MFQLPSLRSQCARVCIWTVQEMSEAPSYPSTFWEPGRTVEPKEVVVSSEVLGGIRSQVLLAIAMIRVYDGRRSSLVCRAFLDNGSQGSFITEHCAQQLRRPRQRLQVSVSGMCSVGVGNVRTSAQLAFSALHSSEVFEVTALVLSQIANFLPTVQIKRESCAYLETLQLADCFYFRPGYVDVLLGADVYGQLVRAGYRSSGSGGPVALETALGWVVLGPVPTQP